MRLPVAGAEYPQALLVLEIAGHTVRYAERGPLYMDVDGTETLFRDGMTMAPVVASISLYGGSAEPRSTSVEVLLPAYITPQDLGSIGVDLIQSRARVYQWAGGDFADAELVIDSRISDPIYGDPAAPQLLSFGMELDFIDFGQTPPPTSKVKLDAHATIVTGDIAEDAIGAYRPEIYGKPGYGPYGPSYSTTSRTYDAITENNAGSPAFPNDYRLVVAGHHVPAAVLTDGIRIWSASGAGADNLNLVNDNDDFNRPICYVDCASYTGTLADIVNDLPASVAWIKEPRSGQLGDVILDLLGRTSMARAEHGIDWQRARALVPVLNRLGRIDCVISEPVAPLDYIRDTIGAVFPIFINDQGQGVYVGVWRWQATAADASYTIDTSLPGYTCIAPISQTGAVHNDVTVEAAYSSTLSRYLASSRWSGDPEVLSEDEDVRTSPLLRRSQSLYGRRDLSVQTSILWDASTISAAAQYLAHRYALPARSVGYSIPWQTHDARMGDVVLVQDSDRGLTDQVGIVDGVQYTGGELQVRVTLLPTNS